METYRHGMRGYTSSAWTVQLKHMLTALLLGTKVLTLRAAVSPLPPAIKHPVLVTRFEERRRVVTCLS